MAAVRYLGF